MNRWLVKPFLAPGPFLHGHFADCLLLPAALPLALWLQRKLGLRGEDHFPTGAEIGMHLTIWAFIAEAAGPVLAHRGTADWWDCAAYSAGAAVCYVLWRKREIPCEQP